LVRQKPVRAIITEERTVFPRRNTNREASWLTRIQFQPGTIDSEAAKAFYHPPSIVVANRPQYSHTNAEFGKTAGGDRGPATHVATEMARKRLFTQFRKCLKTGQDLINKELTDHNYGPALLRH